MKVGKLNLYILSEYIIQWFYLFTAHGDTNEALSNS